MLGLPDKKKIAAAFQGFKDRLASIREQSKISGPPASSHEVFLDKRLTNMEQFIQELSESL